MIQTHDISVDKFVRMVDINKDYTNFSSVFKINCKPENEYQMVVASQTMIDDDDDDNDLNYTTYNGSIEADINIEENNKDNYFLCLKTSKPFEAKIEINTKELPVNDAKLNENAILKRQTEERDYNKSQIGQGSHNQQLFQPQSQFQLQPQTQPQPQPQPQQELWFGNTYNMSIFICGALFLIVLIIFLLKKKE